jgi:hypothetical protein
MVDDRTRVSREVIEALHSSDLPVFGTTIPYRSGAEDQEAVDNGFGLVQALTERAHLDAQQRFEGRRNRGLPRRPVD